MSSSDNASLTRMPVQFFILSECLFLSIYIYPLWYGVVLVKKEMLPENKTTWAPQILHQQMVYTILHFTPKCL